MLLGIESILRQLHEGQAWVDNVYTRAVQVPANPRAQELLAEVFAPEDAAWRGLGIIPGSGVRIREPYARFDARPGSPRSGSASPRRRRRPAAAARSCGACCARRTVSPVPEACTPSQPLGPCMVSSEGACAAAYRYEE